MAWTEAYPSTKWHLDPCNRLATTRGPKLGVLCPPFGGRAGSPSNTMSPGLRSTSVPSGILIHPAVWPQQTWTKNWGCAPFGEGELGPHLKYYGRGRGYLHAKFYLDPSNRLATILQHHRQTGQTDRQRSDSIGRTVFGRLFVKRFALCYRTIVCPVLSVCL